MLNGVGVDQVQHGPNQLIDADGLHADYDDAGNLVELTVARPWCWDDMPECSHRFRYDWDEVGQMSWARRWDFAGGPVPAFAPSVSPVWDLSYSYGEGGRTLTSATDAQGVVRHTLDVFDTLRISRVAYEDANTDYTVEPQNEVGFVGGVARVFYDRANALPKGGDTYVHVYLNIGDHLGSTAFVIDRDTAEVVERTTHQVYGAIDADFRPDRWGASREEFKFTGKEEDIEVGVSYFGARYLNARLGRWMSADPLTIHGLGADLNPYAYVGGHLTTEVDPFGLDGCPAGVMCFPADNITGSRRGWSRAANEAKADRAGAITASRPLQNAAVLQQAIRQLPSVFTGALTRKYLSGADRRPTFRREPRPREFSVLEFLASLDTYAFGEPIPQTVDLRRMLDGKRVDAVIPIAPGKGLAEAMSPFATVLAEDGVKIVDVTTKGGAKLQVMFEEVREGSTLTLKRTHIQGASPEAVGPKELLDLAKQYGREQGAETIVIEGAKRTTSSMAGRFPRPWVLNVNE